MFGGRFNHITLDAVIWIRAKFLAQVASREEYFMKLSEKLKQWRDERPDEWKMDEFIRDAVKIELELEGAKNTEQQVQPDGADKPLAG